MTLSADRDQRPVLATGDDGNDDADDRFRFDARTVIGAGLTLVSLIALCLAVWCTVAFVADYDLHRPAGAVDVRALAGDFSRIQDLDTAAIWSASGWWGLFAASAIGAMITRGHLVALRVIFAVVLVTTAGAALSFAVYLAVQLVAHYHVEAPVDVLAADLLSTIVAWCVFLACAVAILIVCQRR